MIISRRTELFVARVDPLRRTDGLNGKTLSEASIPSSTYSVSVPISENRAIADLPPEIVEAVEEQLGELFDERIEELVDEVPADIRESVESRDGSLEERVTSEVEEK